MENKSFSKSLSAFSSATLISRILGYIRDALVANFFGGGLVTDAFYAAFKVPNLLRRFLGEGALTSAFVPVLAEVSAKKGKEEARAFFSSLFYGLFIVLLIIVALGFVFAPQVACLVAWGFSKDPAKFQLTVDLIRLTFPFIILVSLAALVTSVLNSAGVFFIPALAPAGLSIGEIGFLVMFAGQMPDPIYGLAVSAVVGGVIHFTWQIPRLYKEKFGFLLIRPFGHPEVKTVLLLMGPRILGLCVDQLNSFVDQFFASFLRDGSITALYNSNRIMQLPLALFGVAVSSVALPSLAREASEKNMEKFKDILSFSLRIANFVLIPSAIGLIVLGTPIVAALFEHGRFTERNTWLTVYALIPYVLGLPAYSAGKILASAFYAQKDTKTPVFIGFFSFVLNAVLNYLLMKQFEVAGLAAATSIAAWSQAFLLFIFLRKKIGLLRGRDIMRSFIFGLVAGLLMGLVCYGLRVWVLTSTSVYIQVTIPLLVGAAFYLMTAKILRIKEFDFFMDSFRRKRKPVL